MSITATCSACGKNFIAPSQFLGKRVKCKGCGQVFTVAPAGAPSDDFEHNKPEPAHVPPFAGTATPNSPDRSGGSQFDADDIHAAVASAIQNGRKTAVSNLTPNVLTFAYPGADDVDRWLSPALITIGALLLLASASSADNHGVAWISFTRFLTPVLLYLLVIFPITLTMVSKAAASLRFAMPPHYRQRCFACYVPAFILVIWTITDGFDISQFFAGVLGVIVGSFLLWLLFRLREEQFGTMVVFGAGGFVGGATLSVMLMLGLNKFSQVQVMNQGSQASVPVSPIASGLRWLPAPVETVVAKASAKPAPAASATSPTATLAGISTAPPPSSLGSGTLGTFDLGGIPGVIDEIISPLSTSPFLGIVRRNDSAASVECWDTRTWKALPGTLQLPAMPTGNLIISTDGDHLAWIADFPHLSVQVWSFSGANVAQTVDLDRTQGHPLLVGFISPTQLLIDRTLAKSKTDVAAPSADQPQPATPAAPAAPSDKPRNIFDMTDDETAHANKAPPADATPAPSPKTDAAAGARPRFELYHRFSIVDITSGQTIRSFDLPTLAPDGTTGRALDLSLRFGKNIAISVASQRLAAAIQTTENPSLIQIDLNTGQPLPTIKVPEVDPGMAGSITGLAYSNDGKSLAAMYENGGSALLLSYDSDAGTKVSSFVYPAGPLEGLAHGPFESSAICWLDPAPYLFVYGEGVVSTRTGAHRKSADLTVPSPVDQRYCDGGQVQIITGSPTSKHVYVLRLDPAATDTPLPVPAN
jgi:hypothetical protein